MERYLGRSSTPSPQRAFRANWAMLGDSQTGLLNGAVVISAASYNSTTGVLTLTAASHGLCNGAYVGFSVRNNPSWNARRTAATVIDTNNFSIVFPADQTLFSDVTLARWNKYGTFSSQGVAAWFQSITTGRLRFKGAFGVTGETIPQINNRLSLEVLPVLNPGDLLVVQGGHNDISAPGTVRTAAWSAGIVTMTVSTSEAIAHGLSYRTGNAILVSGCAPTALNGTQTITLVSETDSLTTFTFPLASDPGALTVAGATNYTASAMYSNMYNIVSQASAYGLNVIVLNCTSFGPTLGANTLTARQIMTEYNRRLNELPLLFQNVAVVDAYGVGVDASLTTLTGTSGAGTAKTGYTAAVDLLHYSPRQAQGIALATATASNVWYPVTRNNLMTTGLYSYDATSNPNSLNLIRNAGFTTTTGGAIGGGFAGSCPVTITSGCDLSNANNTTLAMTSSTQASSWGWGGSSIKIGWTYNSGVTFSNNTIRWFSTDVVSRLAPNDKYVFRLYFKTSGLATFLKYIGVIISYTLDGASHTINAGFTYAFNQPLTDFIQTDFDGYMETAEQQIGSGATLSIFTWQVVAVISGQPTGTPFIEAGQLTLEKVI